MAISFKCPNCGADLKAPKEYEGGKARCKFCGRPVKIPKVDRLKPAPDPTSHSSTDRAIHPVSSSPLPDPTSGTYSGLQGTSGGVTDEHDQPTVNQQAPVTPSTGNFKSIVVAILSLVLITTGIIVGIVIHKSSQDATQIPAVATTAIEPGTHELDSRFGKAAQTELMGKTPTVPLTGPSFLEAAESGNVPQLLAHINRGVNINQTSPPGHLSQTALHLAATSGHLKAVIVLCESGAAINTPDFSGDTPLVGAVDAGHISIVDYLVKHGAEFNQVTDNPLSPTVLHLAVRSGRFEIAKVLLDAGADLNARSSSGYTPLMWAIEGGHPEIVSYLLDCGAKVTVRTSFGVTPIHEVVRAGEYRKQLSNDSLSRDALREIKLTVAKMLVAHGADASARDATGNTPLHLAVCGDDPHIYLPLVDYLVSQGADVNALSNSGVTPLDLTSWPEVVQIAQRYGQQADRPIGYLWQDLTVYKQHVAKPLTDELSVAKGMINYCREERNQQPTTVSPSAAKRIELQCIANTVVAPLRELETKVREYRPRSLEFMDVRQKAIGVTKTYINWAKMVHISLQSQEGYIADVEIDIALVFARSSIEMNAAIDECNRLVEPLARKCGVVPANYLIRRLPTAN